VRTPAEIWDALNTVSEAVIMDGDSLSAEQREVLEAALTSSAHALRWVLGEEGPFTKLLSDVIVSYEDKKL
jgi:hypothetical protein